MSTRDALIGVDLGTGSVKAVLVTVDGRLLGRAAMEYPMEHKYPGWAENDPGDWLHACIKVIRELSASAETRGVSVRGLAVVGQRDPFVLLGHSDRVLSSAISWTDARSRSETHELVALVGRDRLLNVTGLLPITGLGLPNLLWTRRHLHSAWEKAIRVAAPKDYILSALCGARGTDTTTPTRSLAYDVRKEQWSDEILSAADLDRNLFDDVRYRPWEPCGSLSRTMADTLGLPLGTILAAGGADDAAATLGCGAVAPGDICIGTGTCADWRIVQSQFTPDMSGTGDASPHVVPGRFIREVAIDSSGSSLRWFRDSLWGAASYGGRRRSNASFTRIVQAAQKIEAGSNGLQFFPHIAGAERAPYFQKDATGVFFGITSYHGRGHFARAVLEGIAYQYPATLALLTEEPVHKPLIMVDGEARSQIWNQMKADVLGHPIQTMAIPEAAALGAAILAGVAAGLYACPEAACSAMIRSGRTYRPRPAEHSEYEGLRRCYEDTFNIVRRAYRAAAGSSRVEDEEGLCG